MKHTLLALTLTSLLSACGGGGGGNDTSTDDWTNRDQPATTTPTDNTSFACTIKTTNGPDSEVTKYFARPVTNDGRFFGDQITFKAECSGGGQLTHWTWEIEEQPRHSEAVLFHNGTKQGGQPDNYLQFWVPGAKVTADGKYVVSLYATNSQGVDSAKVTYEIDYIAAHYLHGSYVELDVDTIDMDDKERPYYIAGPVITKVINIHPGVEVYSSGCNGWEETGYGCEMVAYEEINLLGTAEEPIEVYNGVFRASDDWPATFTANHVKFNKGMINYNNIDNEMEFQSISIDNSDFTDHYGIVVTGDNTSITNSVFENTGHPFTLDERLTAISIKDAEYVNISNNIFMDREVYAIGINSDVSKLPETDYYATGNTYRVAIDDALFDGFDATYNTHGDNLQYVTTIIAN